MNAEDHSGALAHRQTSPVELYRKEAERARENAKQATSARDRAFWLALATNLEMRAKEEEAPKIRPWAT